MFEGFIGIFGCFFFFCAVMIGGIRQEIATKTDCDLRGSIVLQGVVYDCKQRNDPQ